MNLVRKFLRQLRFTVNATMKDYIYNKYHYLSHELGGKNIDYSTLRMYCHMLDKGMNNPHFEKGHSLSIYKRAKYLQEKLTPYYKDDRAFRWVSNIINRFEDAQQSGKPILENQSMIIYTESDVEKYSNFILSRTSCRNFLKKEIPVYILKNIISLAIDAPNGCCRQTTRFYITQNIEKISNLIPNIAGITNFTNIQCLVAVCAECSFYELVDKNLQYIDASLATENFILAARIYNIYGTMCNFFHAGPNEIKNVKTLLGIKRTENVVMFVAMGYPTVVPEKPMRRDIESFYVII